MRQPIIARRAATCALPVLLVACGTADESSTDGGKGGCTAAQVESADGGCRQVGVPPELCAAGFAADGRGGCVPTLPVEPCPPGQMALPGEEICSELSPCGEGTWGQVPVDATSLYVNGSYLQGGSDGSAARPFTSIQEAIDASSPGQLIAIAAGSYQEHLVLHYRSPRMWGRCPALVEVAPQTLGPPTILVREGADGAELHGLAVTGSHSGVGVSGAQQVLIDRVWIHDTGSWGIDTTDQLGPPSLTVTRTLVERATELGISAIGAAIVAEAVVVRDTRPGDGELFGRGVLLRADSDATLRGAVVERNYDAGVFVGGSRALLEGIVIRDTAPLAADGRFGRGLGVQPDPLASGPPDITVRGSVLAANHDVNLFVEGGAAVIEDTTMRDVIPVYTPHSGRGINVQLEVATSTPASAIIRRTLVDSAVDVGIYAGGSDVTIEAVRVSQVAASAEGRWGDGVVAIVLQAPAEVTVTGSHITGVARAALASFAAGMSVSNSTLLCNTIHLDGENLAGAPFSFTDLGGNGCGCDGPLEACKLLSSSLAPPQPLAD